MVPEVAREDPRTGSGTVLRAQFTEEIIEDRWSEPTMVLRSDVAQSLMDALWRIGVRPREVGADPPAEVARIAAHLTDMRAIVAKALQLDLPQGPAK